MHLELSRGALRLLEAGLGLLPVDDAPDGLKVLLKKKE